MVNLQFKYQSGDKLDLNGRFNIGDIVDDPDDQKSLVKVKKAINQALKDLNDKHGCQPMDLQLYDEEGVEILTIERFKEIKPNLFYVWHPNVQDASPTKYFELTAKKVELELELAKPSISDASRKRMLETMEDVSMALRLARIDTGLAFPGSTLVTTVPIYAVENTHYWKAEVVDKEVPRTMVDPAAASFLPAERALVSDLRWLSLRHDARHQLLDSVKQSKGKNEVPFHETLVYICNAAAKGQEDVEFVPEDHRGAIRQDWAAMVRCGTSMTIAAPEECKTEAVLARSTDVKETIDGNSDPFGKLLKVCRHQRLDKGRTTVCIFAAKIEYVWLIAFTFDEEKALKSIEVTPTIPMKRCSILDAVLAKTIVDINTVNNLLDLLSCAPSAGFRLLCRYVDLLSNHPVAISFTRVTGEQIDVTNAAILAYGHHSLVLRSHPDANFVIKVSREDLIQHEVEMHRLVDKNAPCHIRKMVVDGYGTVQGAGSGLSFIMLEGVGSPFDVTHFKRLKIEAWSSIESAVKHMHQCKVLHRDIKPANMICIDGILKLNDFDAACRTDDKHALRDLEVGTPLFRSPKLNGLWKERDDWLGVALSLLSFDHQFENNVNSKKNVIAHYLDEMPQTMQNRVTAA